MNGKFCRDIVEGDLIGLLEELPEASGYRVLKVERDGDTLSVTVTGRVEPIILNPNRQVLLYEDDAKERCH